jgi:limonene-1,2-epoxide hydrolase
MSGGLPHVILKFLRALEARDADAVGACFAENASYHLLVPKPPVTGKAAILGVFETLLSETTAVRWDLVSHAVAGDRVFLERVDRFWYDGKEASIECLGVFELSGGLIETVRDYADHSTWRERKEQVTTA